MRRCIFLIFISLLPFAAFAQNGTLRGQVTDQSGAFAPGATVSLQSAG